MDAAPLKKLVTPILEGREAVLMKSNRQNMITTTYFAILNEKRNPEDQYGKIYIAFPDQALAEKMQHLIEVRRKAADLKKIT